MNLLTYWPQPQLVGKKSNENLVIGAASVSSTKCAENKAYRIASTTDCYIKLTKGAGAATSADMLWPAGYVGVLESCAWDTLSVLQVTAGGVLSITEIQPPH